MRGGVGGTVGVDVGREMVVYSGGGCGTASNGKQVPAAQVALGSNPDGELMKESWNYTSVASKLLYLSTNTHPDIAYAIIQVCQFTSNTSRLMLQPTI
jgi:hypothetical protein